MALSGTLKDFGIADILQLIGQQQKTGVLCVRTHKREVEVSFRDGCIVRAQPESRKRMHLIGTMLVRAEVITQRQLDEALETQRRTLRRVGDILVEARLVSRERFQAMVELQTTETLHDLFQWQSGTYEFRQEPLDEDVETTAPQRAEAILMEGFRVVDEWPVVKKSITSYELSFVVRQPLPPPPPEGAGDGDDAGPSEFKNIGRSERRIFSLITPQRDVRKLIDLSCLGEFETCKALYNLVTLGHLDVVEPSGRLNAVGGTPGLGQRLRPLLGQAFSSAVVLALLFSGASHIRGEGLGLARAADRSYADPAVQRFASRAQMTRIRAALDVYRAERGEFPSNLEALTESGLLSTGDLTHPWSETYYYRREAPGRFILLPPLR